MHVREAPVKLPEIAQNPLELGGYTIGAKPDRETHPPVTCAIFCTTGIVLFSVLLNNIMLYKTYLQPIKISEIFSGIFALQNCAIGAQR
jgi:hypothetical protein